MKVPPQYTIAGMILLCSVIHYYTKYQMYESVRILMALILALISHLNPARPALHTYYQDNVRAEVVLGCVASVHCTVQSGGNAPW